MAVSEMDAKSKLKRFCYLGSFDPVYIRPRGGIQVEKHFPYVKAAVETLDDVAFVLFMSEVLRENVPRKDEPTFLYATYLACDVNVQFKTNVRNAVPQALRSAEELFLFCKYSRLIRVLKDRKSFSRTTKKAIVSWYESRTPESLREMWLTHRGMYGFTHKSLLRMCYINDETLGDKVVTSVFFKTCSELMKDDNLKEEAAIQEISTLRTTVKKNEAAKIVRNMRLSWDQVPPHLLKYATVVELLLPQMSLFEIMKKWHVFHKHRHFENAKVFKLITSSTNKEAQQKANLHPTVYLWRMDKLGIPVTRDELKKVQQKRSQAMRMDHFQQMYRDSFSLNRALGIRSLVAVTLQDNYKKKFLTNHKKVTYYQAAVSLAFSLHKREKHTDIFSFTEDKVKLMQIPWERGIQHKEATDICDQINFKKSSQRLVQPLMEALSRKQIYDLILIIVPSAGRSNPNQSSNLLCRFLDKYREIKNKKAKLVIVSLLKYKKSMAYSTERNENILEICGLDANTGNLIDSFALNRFY